MRIKWVDSFEGRPDAMQGVPMLSLGLVLAVQAAAPPTVLLQPTAPPPSPPTAPTSAAPVGIGPSRAVVHLTIGEDGRVTGCIVKESTGNPAVDTATCRIAFQRVKYSVRTDASPGTPLRTVDLPVRWQIDQ